MMMAKWSKYKGFNHGEFISYELRNEENTKASKVTKWGNTKELKLYKRDIPKGGWTMCHTEQCDTVTIAKRKGEEWVNV